MREDLFGAVYSARVPERWDGEEESLQNGYGRYCAVSKPIPISFEAHFDRHPSPPMLCCDVCVCFARNEASISLCRRTALESCPHLLPPPSYVMNRLRSLFKPARAGSSHLPETTTQNIIAPSSNATNMSVCVTGHRPKVGKAGSLIF
jgi:hypothetical protein